MKLIIFIAYSLATKSIHEFFVSQSQRL